MIYENTHGQFMQRYSFQEILNCLDSELHAIYFTQYNDVEKWNIYRKMMHEFPVENDEQYIHSNNNMAVGLGDKLIKRKRLFCNFLMPVKSKVYLLFLLHALSPHQSRHQCDHRVPITGIIMLIVTSSFWSLSLSQLSAMWSISPPPPSLSNKFLRNCRFHFCMVKNDKKQVFTAQSGYKTRL